MNDQYFKAGYAFKPQSNVGDIIAIAERNIFKASQNQEKSFLKDTKLLLNVHDSLGFSRKNICAKDTVAFIVYIINMMKVKHIIHGREVIIPVDCKISYYNWLDMKELDCTNTETIYEDVYKYYFAR